MNVTDPCREDVRQAASRRLDQLTKPPGSLGRLESLAIDLCHMQRSLRPVLDPVELLLFAADHGLASAGVSAYPPCVTAQMVRNFLEGGAAASVLAREHRCALRVVDVGVAAELDPHPQLQQFSVARGTANSLECDAMTVEQYRMAFGAGAAAARQAVERGARVVLLGEMGIGNTSAASLLLAGMTGWPLARCVGPGTGLDAAGLERKRAILERVWLRALSQGAWPGDPGDAAAAMMQRFGGFEIVALAAAAATAAALGSVVLVDGFVVSVAVALAERCSPGTLSQCVFSHCSAETAHRALLTWLGVTPLLDLGMRLGEGSGALLALPLLRSAVAIFRDMATFQDAGVSTATTAGA